MKPSDSLKASGTLTARFHIDLCDILDEQDARLQRLEEENKDLKRALSITNRLSHVFTYQQVHGGVSKEWDALESDRNWLKKFIEKK